MSHNFVIFEIDPDFMYGDKDVNQKNPKSNKVFSTLLRT